MTVTRLVSFLGTTNYDFATFWDQSTDAHSSVHRLTDLATIESMPSSVRALQVVVLGTIDVWRKWFSGLTDVVGGRYCEDLLETRYHERFDSFELYFLAVTKGVVESSDLLPLDPDATEAQLGAKAVDRTRAEQWALFGVMDIALNSPFPLGSDTKEVTTSSGHELDLMRELDQPRVVPLFRHGPSLPDKVPSHVLLDVSNGFRSQPIFAASAMSYSAFKRKYSERKTGATSTAPIIDVRYCAYDPQRHRAAAGTIQGERPSPSAPPPARIALFLQESTAGQSERLIAPVPVVDLTNVVAADTWLSALSDFLRHGRGDNLQQACLLLAGKLGRNGVPLKQFGLSIKNLSDGVCTLRVQECITKLSSKVFEAHKKAASLIGTHLPFAIDEFKRIEQLSSRMHTPQLLSPEGLAAWIAYGEQCVMWERYTEAIAVAREGYVVALRVRMDPGAGQPERDWKWQVYESIRINSESQILEYKPSSQYSELALDDAALTRDVRLLANLKFQASQSRNDALHCGLNESAGQNMRVQADEMIKKLRRELGQVWKELFTPT
jgi:hypothetical protein